MRRCDYLSEKAFAANELEESFSLSNDCRKSLGEIE